MLSYDIVYFTTRVNCFESAPQSGQGEVVKFYALPKSFKHPHSPLALKWRILTRILDFIRVLFSSMIEEVIFLNSRNNIINLRKDRHQWARWNLNPALVFQSDIEPIIHPETPNKPFKRIYIQRISQYLFSLAILNRNSWVQNMNFLMQKIT